MTTNFYDKVAMKFGGYAFGSGHVVYRSIYPNGDPEKNFKEKLLDVSTINKKALDAGCGDGKFAYQIAKYFLSITGIDTSKELLKIARQKHKKFHVNNLTFKFQNASKTLFPNNFFDVIFSRRGPTPFSEFQRILKTSGYYLGIDIGEKDCQTIKELFGRGQGYKKWGESKLEIDKQKLKDAEFETVFARDYFYDEYYASYKDLDKFLQSVPIFEDFDSEKDRNFLKEYVAEFKTRKGIRLPRHRLVFVAKKM